MIWLLVATFLSGLAALVYELLWVRQLTLLAGRVVRRLTRPLRLYCLIELVIGGWAALFNPLLATLDNAYAYLYAELPAGSPWIHVLRAGFRRDPEERLATEVTEPTEKKRPC